VSGSCARPKRRRLRMARGVVWASILTRARSRYTESLARVEVRSFHKVLNSLFATVLAISLYKATLFSDLGLPERVVTEYLCFNL